MEDLIRALNIFIKYGNRNWPTHCYFGVLAIVGIAPDKVSAKDKKKLASLSFIVHKERDCFISYRFGSE